MTADAITLSIPLGDRFHGVARLVVGGLAARLNLSYEHLEDLQLALESVLENEKYLAAEIVIVRLVIGESSIGMVIGPVKPNLRAELEPREESEDGIALRRLLAALVDEIDVQGEDGTDWLRLDKRVALTRPGAAA